MEHFEFYSNAYFIIVNKMRNKTINVHISNEKLNGTAKWQKIASLEFFSKQS